MLLSETVEISVLNNNKKYLKSKGYDISKDKINIKVSDLSKGSKVKVLVKCDICYKEKNIGFYSYNKSLKKGGYYTCSSKCSNSKRERSNLKKYGSKWASQNDEIKKKVKKTNIEKYGIECSLHTEEVQKKVKETNLKKYGTEWASQSDIIKEKTKSTNIERYGVQWGFQSDEIKSKVKKTNIERYGVENPMKNIDIFNRSRETKLERYGDPNYNNIEKTIMTNLEKYGFEYFTQTDEYIKKTIETNLKKYGTEWTSQNEEVKDKVKSTKLDKYGDPNYNNIEKIKSTNREKYGVDYSLQSKEVRDKIIKTNLEKYGDVTTLKLDRVRIARNNGFNKRNKKYAIETYSKILPPEYEILNYESGDLVIKHGDHEFISSIKLIYDRLKYSKVSEICTTCNPLNSNQSSNENEIYEWLKSMDLNPIRGDRKVMEDGKELDIYLPKYKLAIEFNGLYWHSELFKNKKYHLNKTLLCRDKGIGLIHIFEDDWRYKKDIVKSIILNKLGLIENKIYARKCIIKEIPLNICKKFINDNHIQGYSRCKYKLGLYYKNELVSVMTFGYRYINSKKEFELIRFCNKENLNIIGGASKLFKYFIRNYDGFDKIVSYADISMFNGGLYGKLGFELKHLSKPNYFWVIGDKRHHRFKYNKRKLVEKMGGDPNKSGSQIMNEMGHYKIWSCGQLRFEFNILKL